MKKILFAFGILAVPYMAAVAQDNEGMWIRGDSVFVQGPQAGSAVQAAKALHIGDCACPTQSENDGTPNDPNPDVFVEPAHLRFEEGGYMWNHGTVTVTGDVVNNNPNVPFPQPPISQYNQPAPFVVGPSRLFEHDPNNLVAPRGTVWLRNKDAIQYIRSEINQSFVRFNTLRLECGAQHKELQVDALTDPLNRLLIGECELKTNTFSMVVENPSPIAIDTAGGYVSSDPTIGFRANLTLPRAGRLIRYMQNNTDRDYLFPVGANGLSVTPLREVEIIPSVPTGRWYAVRVCANDPTPDGWPRDNRDEDITCEINDGYYHIIEDITNLRLDMGFDPTVTTLPYDVVTNPTATNTLKVYHNNDVTPPWDELVNYSGPNDQWENMKATLDAPATKYAIVSGWQQFSDDQAFAFSAKAPAGGITLPIPNNPPNIECALYEDVTVGDTVLFSPNPDDVNDFFAHEWNFGDSTYSTEPSPEHIYKKWGPVTVYHTVLNPNFPECKKVECLRLNVKPRFGMILPDAFTPGYYADGNEVFEASLFGISSFEFTVFNRWGQSIVDPADNPNGGQLDLKDAASYRVKLWNGNMHNQAGGTACPEGVYVYVLKAVSSIDGKTYTRSGSITLIR